MEYIHDLHNNNSDHFPHNYFSQLDHEIQDMRTLHVSHSYQESSTLYLDSLYLKYSLFLSASITTEYTPWRFCNTCITFLLHISQWMFTFRLQVLNGYINSLGKYKIHFNSKDSTAATLITWNNKTMSYNSEAIFQTASLSNS